MKKSLFILTLVISSFAVIAQDESGKVLKFSIGVDAALPLGDWDNIYSFGIGGSAQADYMVAPELGLTLHAGYLNLSGKDYNVLGTNAKYPSLGLVPVLAGIKYYFSPKFYGSAQLGATFVTEGGGSLFTYAPGIGYYFSENLDAGIKYTGMSDDGESVSLLGLRIAYTF